MSMMQLPYWLDAGKTVLNGYCMIADPFVAEAFARQGFDAVTIDLQHGLADYASALRMLQAMTSCDVVPLVRVPGLDPGLMMKLLDAGALGITCPMISSAAAAEQFVRSTSYPPLGERSLGPIRAGLIYGRDYAGQANAAIARLAMIETAAGLENVEAIAAVPGLTGLYIGPGDLSLALGRPSRYDGFDPIVEKAVERILAACRANNIIAGTFAPTAERANELRRLGFRFITLNTDIAALQQQAKVWVDGYRKLAEDG
ncbi:aldolase/citrate lyase family protein [Bosea sp. (in: a-proteobacteria)]|uniref:HpcH/HpaI aldolase family protein n=1 Tax=Bosea sp. (in: a-proteobacteria) TaxID=1871050 RepID=UPI002631124B|nr:aldolase/citrate lyase family protein [Bosea sp. (in: a-proteobacteria)]MCO5089636.1 aldolase/citrate lyase family protein [Bosea sp. (in: a-proteobacteria)]